ncbi:MAG: lichenicidin A2 family type 2 lantibiotic [Bifidobacterium dentium]
MNEKAIVGGTFDDLSDEEMAMLTGRGTAQTYSTSDTVIGCAFELSFSLILTLTYCISQMTCKKK